MDDLVPAPPGDLICRLGGDVDYDEPLRNALAHSFTGVDVAANRPTYALICRWIHSGWGGLKPGVHPWVLSPWSTQGAGAGTQPASVLWPPWDPVYPFAGDSQGVERLFQWPSSAASPWLLGNTPAVGQWGANSPWQGACNAGPWVRLGGTWFVLMQSPSTNFGASPLEASVVGLAIRALQAAVDRLNLWIPDHVANLPSVAVGDLPGQNPEHPANFTGLTGLGPGRSLDVLADVSNLPAVSIIPVWANWITGRAGQPLHIVVDPALGGEAGGAGMARRRNIIRLRREQVVSTEEWAGGRNPRPEFVDLVAAARLHWARQTYGPVPMPVDVPTWIPYDTLNAAANQVARIAGLIAHETLHLVWRSEFGMPWNIATPEDSSTDDPWGCECVSSVVPGECGPGLAAGVPGAPPWRTYQYVPDSSLDQAGSNASKHYIHYLVQEIVEGLLRHRMPRGLFGGLDEEGVNHGCW